MLSVIRLFLISLLVVLQFAAPLLHAHKDSGENFGSAIHLPEFEQVSTRLKHAPEFTALTNHDGSFIALSAGIQNETFSFSQTQNSVFILLISLFLVAKVAQKSPDFSLLTEPILNSPFLNLISPRAPPFLHFV